MTKEQKKQPKLEYYEDKESKKGQEKKVKFKKGKKSQNHMNESQSSKESTNGLKSENKPDNKIQNEERLQVQVSPKYWSNREIEKNLKMTKEQKSRQKTNPINMRRV